MDKKRDFIDDLIDIQHDWQAVRNPLAKVTDVLAADPQEALKYSFNPAVYKEKPRTNSLFCLNVCSKTRDACTRCLDICPTDAIEIGERTVKITDDCRKCGLCVMICPVEVFLTQKSMAKGMYDKIARVASAYEKVYISCTRAFGRLGRTPKENEIILPCVGVMPRELWFSLLVEYDNIEVYLPLGICDKCKTSTGEMAYSEEIAAAEEYSRAQVALEIDDKNLQHEQTRSYKRGQFVNSVVKSGQALASAANPTLAGAAAIAKKIQEHSNQLYEMQRALETQVGEKTTTQRRRILTQKRKLLLATLQKRPAFAKRFSDLEVPVCDSTKCTLCGDCVETCSVRAIDLSKNGRIVVEEAYCTNCGACALICPEDALEMQPGHTQELIVVDPEAKRKEELAKKEKERLLKAAEKSKATFYKSMNMLENLADKDTKK